MNRRTFVGRTILGLLALSLPVFTTGCNVMNDLLNWIPVGLQALTQILSLLSGAGIVLGPSVTATISVIQSGLADLKLAIVQYKATTPPPVGVLAKIDTLLSDIVANIGNVLSQLPAQPVNLITLIVGLFELLLSTLQGFISQMPMPASLPKTISAMARPINIQGRIAVVVAERNLSRRHFIHKFNSLATAGGRPDAKLPESLVQHL